MARKTERGNALIEFTLVGIPLIFVLLSTFEMARAMWTYETLAYAAKEATRFVIVKGQNCALMENECWVTVGRVAQEIRRAGVGLDASQLSVTLIAGSSLGPKSLTAHLADTTPWPVLNPADPDAAAAPGRTLRIEVRYPFRSVMAMLWPGTGEAQIFGAYTFRAQSEEQIQF